MFYYTAGAVIVFALAVVFLMAAIAEGYGPRLFLLLAAMISVGVSLLIPVLWRLLALATLAVAEIRGLRAEAAARHTTTAALVTDVQALRADLTARHTTIAALVTDIRTLWNDVKSGRSTPDRAPKSAVASLRAETTAGLRTITDLQTEVFAQVSAIRAALDRTQTAAGLRTLLDLQTEVSAQVSALRAELDALPQRLAPPPPLPAASAAPEPVWRCLQPLDTRDDRPLAIQVASRIEEAIAQGRLAAGVDLPTDAAIASHLRVATATARKAKLHLLDSGAIEPASRRRYTVPYPSTPASPPPDAAPNQADAAAP